MMGKRGVIAAGVGVMVATVLAGGVAWATIPGGDGVIHSCYAKSGGAVRVIDSSVTNCAKNETSLNWNVQGVKGDPGTNGTNGTNGKDGINGTNGTDGKDGVSGWERVVSDGVDVAAGAVGTREAVCPSGKKAVGGGHLVYGPYLPDISLSTSQPDFDGSSWFVEIRNMGAQPTTLVAYAVCVIAP
jgi:hypothetical protein